MALVLDAFVAVLQIGVLGFLAWGGWLALRSQFPERRARTRAQRVGAAPAQHFERVASLVLLALFFTTSLALV